MYALPSSRSNIKKNTQEQSMSRLVHIYKCRVHTHICIFYTNIITREFIWYAFRSDDEFFHCFCFVFDWKIKKKHIFLLFCCDCTRLLVFHQLNWTNAFLWRDWRVERDREKSVQKLTKAFNREKKYLEHNKKRRWLMKIHIYRNIYYDMD